MKTQGECEIRVSNIKNQFKQIEHFCDFLKDKVRIAGNQIRVDDFCELDDVLATAKRVKDQAYAIGDKIDGLHFSINDEIKWIESYKDEMEQKELEKKEAALYD